MDKIQQKSEMMFALIDEFHTSGCTKKHFCRDKGVNLATFSYWMKKKNQTKHFPNPDFISIQPEANTIKAELEISYPNGVKIKLFTVQPALLALLIKL